MVIIANMNMLNLKISRWRAAFTLVEILSAVAILSAVTALAVVSVRKFSEGTGNSKLRSDVLVLNNAIRTRMMSGGAFATGDLAGPAAIIAKLKQRATTASAKQLAGQRGSLVDKRLTFRTQTFAEAASSADRAVFIGDPENPHFAVTNSGSAGIAQFILDTSLGDSEYGTEERNGYLKLAKEDGWVWDFSNSPAGNEPPQLPPLPNDAGNQIIPSPSDDDNITLNPPDFSLATGSAPWISYPRSLTLIPANSTLVSQISYSINSAPFQEYSSAITVDPGMTVTAVSVSLDSDRYNDSPAAAQTYTVELFTPIPVVTFTKSSYSFFELGGAAAPGTPDPSPSGAASGEGQIQNIADIPPEYQNSSLLRYVWTMDGTDPLVSGTAIQQPAFTSWTPAEIPLPLSAFGLSTSVTVRSVVKAINPAITRNSEIITRILTVDSKLLRMPLVAMDGRNVTLSLDLSQRDMPAGARIYYTRDDTDPGVGSTGEPLRGTLYTGVPFRLIGDLDSIQNIRTRVYAPTGYPQFFLASNERHETFPLPPTSERYVGGSFAYSAPSTTARNIARLLPTGHVDLNFDPGSGATIGSIVGIVRQNGSGVLVGGDFADMNSSPLPALVRLNDNGSVDSSFNAALGGLD